jgi:hypothetical protein
MFTNVSWSSLSRAPCFVISLPGANRNEVQVRSTQVNHYLTISTQYRGLTKAGLIGSVRVLWEEAR